MKSAYILTKYLQDICTEKEKIFHENLKKNLNKWKYRAC